MEKSSRSSLLRGRSRPEIFFQPLSPHGVEFRIGGKMAETTHLNGLRNEALNRMERSERNFKIAFCSGLVIEGLFLVGFFLIANFKDPLHILLLISTIASYSIIIFGLIALGAHVSRNTQSVLRAIELIERKGAQDSERQSLSISQLENLDEEDRVADL